MSFLSKLSKLKKSGPGYQPPATAHTEDKPLLPRNYIRDEDPAVRRLKEKRRLEQLKSGTPKPKPKKRRAAPGTSVSRTGKPREDERDVATVYKRPVGSARGPHKAVAPEKPREPLKKLSFEELMREAEAAAVATTATVAATAPPRVTKPGFKQRTRAAPGPVARGPGPVARGPGPAKHSAAKHAPPPPLRIRAAPQGLARPNAKLQHRLSQRHRKNDRRTADEQYSDEDLSDFIEDDEAEAEAMGDTGSHREEIWAMFQRPGQRRAGAGARARARAYDSDSDEMETNEMDIMAEEEAAAEEARREDRREQQWLRKHDEEKRRRRGRG